MLVTTIVYWPGLFGDWLFDDYPNIVNNPGVQPHEVSVPALVRAALSSPASEFKRPLASLSFAANYLAGGLNPWGWKLFNLVVHLLNGVLVFLLARMLLLAATPSSSSTQAKDGERWQADIVATLIAAGWMLLPINLTAVLYVVQREESMANLFVLLGLVGYVAGRRHMLRSREGGGWCGFVLCIANLILVTIVGLLTKETAAMLPLYAFLIEWILFRFSRASLLAEEHPAHDDASTEASITHGTRLGTKQDWRIAGLFVVVLALPLLIGLIWLLPNVLSSASWATRDFTLGTRLLSEARIICDYIVWTLLPTPHALSFYHDQFRISTGILSPWTTLAGLLGIAALIALVFWLRRRQPLVALGIALYLGCHLMTGTIIALELVYEHRNYFASFGVLLVVIPWLAAIPPWAVQPSAHRYHWLQPRRTLLACLLLWWIGLTAATAYAWGDPLRLAQQLAARAPDSPRAQYELGRTYIIYSHYDPASPYTQLAYAPLEKAASFPESSILPQQALIFMNSRMDRPLKPQWWDSMIAKLKARKPGVQDESSLAALAQCARDGACPLPTDRMVQAFEAALDHPGPSARLQSTYSDYAWNVLGNHALGLHMIQGAVKDAPNEPAYRITLVRMLVAAGSIDKAREELPPLYRLNVGGRLDRNLSELRSLPGMSEAPGHSGTTGHAY
ncbi:tetratricopeptide repeat protein [Dyella agri]|uniref:tetratricopeptide repeat protein n=1 Tax=Dyella agri TaxID=1926869 RepID=UPI00384D50E4